MYGSTERAAVKFCCEMKLLKIETELLNARTVSLQELGVHA